jgi:hypothetical protein
MSYKPERKYISEIKGLVNTSWTETGGRWFDGVEPAGSHTATSFEILRNDFTLLGSGNNLRLSEAGTYHIKYEAILDLNDTTSPQSMVFAHPGSAGGWTPNMQFISNSGPIGYTNLRREFTDITINSVDCRSVSLELTLDFDPSTGNSNQIYARYYSNKNHVDEWIYQRIEITKI